MLTYVNYRTPAEFDVGYENFIDAPVIERWEKYFRGESAKALALPHAEFAYDPAERNRIDVFPAPNAKPDAPILIAIHGGLWFLFDKWLMHFLAPAFTAAGVHVACPNYRLAPTASLDDIVADCRRAIAYVHKERQQAGLGSGPLFVTGHSAAGQLAAVMASTNWSAFDARLPPDLIKGLVGVSGFYDIEPFIHTRFQPQVKFAADAYRRWSPDNLVHPGMPPALLVTGANESGLLHEMMEGYASRLRHFGVAVDSYDAAGEDHFSVLSRLGDPSSEVHRLALRLIQS